RQNDLDGGKTLAEQALAEARAHGMFFVEATCVNVLQIVAEYKGAVTEYLEFSHQYLDASRAAGNPRLEGFARGNLGIGWLKAGNIDRARPELEECLRLGRANGDRASECGALCSLSTIALWQGEDPRARGLARAAVDAAVAVQAPLWKAYALFTLANAELALGRYDAAANTYRAAYEGAVNLGHPIQHDASAGLARAALAQGDVNAALEAVRRLPALDLHGDASTDPLDGAEAPRWIEWTAYLVLRRAGDARADAWLRRAHNALQRQAAALNDPQLREGFLQNIPHHREILAEWKARPDLAGAA
ncbi:MAG: hypothetical protein M3Z31_11920, partial [Pseudomonadota bacterium]|nr:hypothetical protein [Pseudomonadota bacterium]